MRIARLAILLVLTLIAAARAGELKIQWQPWSDDLFDRAAKENKLVILDLEAVWCHWCHVMDHETYSDAKVIELINSRYIAVRVDQDSRPDLATRYGDWGWPATIFFDSHGKELVKRRGYIPPENMRSLLQAIIDDPTPGPSIQPTEKLEPAGAALSPKLRDELRKRLVDLYDEKNGAWGTNQKYIDWGNVEYCLDRAATGDKQAEKMATQTLTAARKIIDPVWGGVDQYSTDGDWDHPHYEKIMQFQAEDMRIYSRAFAQLDDQTYRQSATDIERFLKNFLTSPQGAFYTSMDADLVPGQHSAEYFTLDDAGRRKLGVPRIDQHIYARENGWAITGLCSLYAATGDKQFLDRAMTALEWIAANRQFENGGFSHDEKDAAGPYLGDTLAMGRAFLAAYAVTGNIKALDASNACAAFINRRFKSDVGFATTDVSKESSLSPIVDYDENIMLARWTNLLSRYTGKPEHKAMAEHAMKYLAAAVANRRGSSVGGILLADAELASEPLHITIVGSKTDPVAKELFLAAVRYPASYKRVEWYDSKQGPLPNMDVEYPQLESPAAFICTGNACSSPMTSVESLNAKLQKSN